MRNLFLTSYKLKLRILDNKFVIIDNYSKIISSTDSLMIIDKYQIYGQNLLINYIDNNLIKISGIINEIKII